MRASPLGVLRTRSDAARAAAIARPDAALTHAHPACGDATAAFVVAVAHAVREGDGPEAAWQAAASWARDAGAAPLVLEALEAARSEPPVCDGADQGWVRIALQNAFYELLHAPTLEEGVVRDRAARRRHRHERRDRRRAARRRARPQRGAGAVAVDGPQLPADCAGGSATQPRPREYWPVDVLEIAERLLLEGEQPEPAPA